MEDSMEKVMHDFFTREIKPFLAPYVIGNSQPMPYLPEDREYILTVMKTRKGNMKVGIIPLDDEMCKIYDIPGHRKARKAELICNYISDIYANYKVESTSYMILKREDKKITSINLSDRIKLSQALFVCQITGIDIKNIMYDMEAAV